MFLFQDKLFCFGGRGGGSLCMENTIFKLQIFTVLRHSSWYRCTAEDFHTVPDLKDLLSSAAFDGSPK